MYICMRWLFIFFCALSLFFDVHFSVFAVNVDNRRPRIHPPAYAYLDCSACIAFAEYLGRRMNASLKFDGGSAASFLSAKSAEKANASIGKFYASSELRAAEVLDKICNDDLEENYVLRLDLDRRIRVYESEKTVLPFAQHYSTQDMAALKQVSRTALRSFCTYVMGEAEEAMMSLVREVERLDEVERRLCGGNDVNSSVLTGPRLSPEEMVTTVCLDTEESLRLELGRIQRYEDWQNSIARLRDEAIKKNGGKSSEPIIAKEVPPERAKMQKFFLNPDSHELEEGDDEFDDEGGQFDTKDEFGDVEGASDL